MESNTPADPVWGDSKPHTSFTEYIESNPFDREPTDEELTEIEKQIKKYRRGRK